MKQHTAQFKSELKQMGKQIDCIVTYGTTTLHDELMTIIPLFKADILKSVMKQLEIESTVDIPLETVVNCKIGVLVDEDYEYLDYGNYVVYSSKKQEDLNTYKITCYDKMLYAMKPYEEIPEVYPITIKNYLTMIGNRIGLNVKNTNFYNSSLEIHEDLYKGMEYTYRDVLDEIAEATGSFIIINGDDEIEVKYPTYTSDTIDEEYFKDTNVNFKEKYGPINSIVLSRAGESDNVYIHDEPSIEENGLCELKIIDNQIMNKNDRADYLQGLLSALDGLEYYINDYKSTGILYYETGDIYNAQIGENTYQCIMFNDEIDVVNGIEEFVYTEMPQKSQTDYTKADKTDRKINQTYLIVDKQNQTIESVVSTVTEQNNKISQITQTVDDIASQISDIADITTYGESSYASVTLSDVNDSEPIMLKVHPTTQNISYLYPRNNLYPSDDLYMQSRTIRFVRTYREAGETRTENIDYELPDDLLAYSDTVYDEFYLDYESRTCQVTKKCQYNADGTVSPLGTEVVTTYEYPTIALGEGNYEIKLLTYNYGYVYVRLMAKNIYTSQFYTKIETNTLIDQTASSINLSVNQRLQNYSTTNQMNTAINLSTQNIMSTVSSTYATKNETQELSSRITQNANSITAEVTRATTKENTLLASINLKVDKDDNNQIVSMINASANVITLNSNRLIINSTNFKLNSSGNITATGGTIGGFTISNSYIANGTTSLAGANNSVYIGTDGISCGTNFKATKDGKITSKSGTIGGFTIESNKLYNGKSSLTASSNGVYIGTDGISCGTGSTFKVTPNGNLTCVSGQIGGFTIANTKLYNGKSSLTASSNGVYIGTDGISCGTGSTFKVTPNGEVTCSNINITGGKITLRDRNSQGALIIYAGSTQYNYSIMTGSDIQIRGGTNNSVEIHSDNDGNSTVEVLSLYDGTYIRPNSVTTPVVIQTSLESKKKNIELYKESAINIVKNSKLYTYNFKSEKDEEKKHIGFVIGDEGGKYNTPQQVISINGKGIDAYTMLSILWKSVQEILDMEGI